MIKNNKKAFSKEAAEKRLAQISGELKRRELEMSFEWHPRQKAAIEAIEKARHEGSGIPRLLYGGSVGGGKSFLGCKYAVDICEKVPGNRWYVCRREQSTFMKTTYITMTDVVDILNRPGWNQSLSGKYFVHDNRSRIDYGGLGGDKKEDVDKVKSMDLGGLFIDEASEVDDKVTKMAMARVGRVIKAQGYEAVILASNPEQCWLISAFLQDPAPGWVYVPSLPTDNPHLTEMYINNIKDIYGSSPDLYKAYIEGDWFAVGAADKIFDITDFENAVKREEEAASPVELGADIARYGDDKTIISGKFGPKVAILGKYQKQDILATCELISKFAQKYNPYVIKVDSTGLGSGVEDVLHGWGLPVVGIISAGGAVNKNRFANFKTEMAFSFKEQMKYLDLPDDADLREQVLTIRYRIMPGGKLNLETKDQLKKRLGGSPDELDSIMLACLDVSPYVQPHGIQTPLRNTKVNISPM